MKKLIILSILILTLFIVIPNAYEISAMDGAQIGQCFADCAAEQGICMGQCDGDSQCIGNCAAAHGRCVSRCH